VLGAGAVVVRWSCGEAEGELVLAANLSTTRAAVGFPPARGRVLWSEGVVRMNGSFGPWAVRWSLDGAAPGDGASVTNARAHG